MPIDFTCPHCGTRTNVADEYAGMSGPCATCGKTIKIPGGQYPFASQPPFHQPGSDLADSAALRMLMPVGRSGWAIAAGYAGLFAVLVFPAPIALLLGIIAIFHIKNNSKLHGMGRAIFGLIMGLLGTGLLLVFLIGLLLEG
ncbi:MAG: hypothetical protein JXM70_20175 [Pirellulales bacterium]|nr:hypothetical protein [Pirellulales bacterium]